MKRYTTKTMVLHGQLVQVKVLKPRKRNLTDKARVRGGVNQAGAKHIARENGQILSKEEQEERKRKELVR